MPILCQWGVNHVRCKAWPLLGVNCSGISGVRQQGSLQESLGRRILTDVALQVDRAGSGAPKGTDTYVPNCCELPGHRCLSPSSRSGNQPTVTQMTAFLAALQCPWRFLSSTSQPCPPSSVQTLAKYTNAMLPAPFAPIDDTLIRPWLFGYLRKNSRQPSDGRPWSIFGESYSRAPLVLGQSVFRP